MTARTRGSSQFVLCVRWRICIGRSLFIRFNHRMWLRRQQGVCR